MSDDIRRICPACFQSAHPNRPHDNCGCSCAIPEPDAMPTGEEIAGAAGLIELPPRRPGLRPWTGVELRTSCRITGADQVDTFEMMCAFEGCRPHELVARIVLEAIRTGQENHAIQAAVKAARRNKAGLRLVPGVVSSRAGRHELLQIAVGDEEAARQHRGAVERGDE